MCTDGLIYSFFLTLIMVYELVIPKSYYPILKQICEEYGSYRECVLKKIEEKYNVKFETRYHSMTRKFTENVDKKPVTIKIAPHEQTVIEKIAKERGTSVRQIILEALGLR